jgi:hypothetical protein
MILGLTFAQPLLLLGLAAACVPFVLHLLSSVRAKEVTFPTLRFLRLSMEKTARRRRVQHWLLLLLRALVLALLALAVAQPISDAAGGWIASESSAALLVLDNSYSMAAGEEESALERARRQARELLAAEPQPQLAGLMTTSGGFVSSDLTADMDHLRGRLEEVDIGYAPDLLAQRVARAISLLASRKSAGRKAVYVLTDFQRGSMERLLMLRDLASARDVHLLLIDAGSGDAQNVGISDLEIRGQAVRGARIQVTVTVTNSSKSARTAQVELRMEAKATGQGRVVSLAPAGSEGSVASLDFHHALDRAGTVTGQVVLTSEDALEQDNVRRFALNVAPRARVLVVRGGGEENPFFDPARTLLIALEHEQIAWPVEAKVVDHQAFAGEDLEGCAAAFFCEVPAMSETQAQAIEAFTASGKTSVFFLGPAVRPDVYNRLLYRPDSENSLMPAKLSGPVGKLGLDVPAIPAGSVDLTHPVMQGLYPRRSLYLQRVFVQRYFRFASKRGSSPRAPREDLNAQVLMRLVNGAPLIVSRPVGKGTSVVVTVPASLRWSSLPRSRFFLPLVERLALLHQAPRRREASWPAGSKALIRPENETADPAGLNLVVSPPALANAPAQDITLGLVQTPLGHGAYFSQTSRPGFYRWKLLDEPGDVRDQGALAVNPAAEEGDLSRMAPEAVIQQLQRRGLDRAYAGSSVQQVQSAAAADTVGRNWWDLLAAGVILLLVVEAVLANRRRTDGG